MKVTTSGSSVYIIPTTGIYKIECHGAGGGAQSVSNKSYSSDTHGTIYCGGGKGGKTIYYASLTVGTKLYLCVGGTGTTSKGGYNGGGKPDQGKTGQDPDTKETYILAYGGGGATHVALRSGLLTTFSPKDADLLCVAGGGGGSAGSGGPKNELNAVRICNGVGGNGGGSSGGTSKCYADYGSQTSPGGTQTEAGGFNDTVKGAFGKGGVGNGYYQQDNFWDKYDQPDVYDPDDTRGTNCGGGGGGYYGGSGGNGYIWSQAGGGGSGYIKTRTTTSYYVSTAYTNSTTAGSGSNPTVDGSIEITLVESATPSINKYAYTAIYLRWKMPLADTNGYFTIHLEASNDINFSSFSSYTYTTTDSYMNLYNTTFYQQYKYLRYKISGHNNNGTVVFTSNYSDICTLIDLQDRQISIDFYNNAKMILDSNYQYLVGQSPTEYNSPSQQQLIYYDDLVPLATLLNETMGLNFAFNQNQPLDIDKQALLYYL